MLYQDSRHTYWGNADWFFSWALFSPMAHIPCVIAVITAPAISHLAKSLSPTLKATASTCIEDPHPFNPQSDGINYNMQCQ